MVGKTSQTDMGVPSQEQSVVLNIKPATVSLNHEHCHYKVSVLVGFVSGNYGSALGNLF